MKPRQRPKILCKILCNIFFIAGWGFATAVMAQTPPEPPLLELPATSIPIEDKTHQASQAVSTPPPPLELLPPEQPSRPAETNPPTPSPAPPPTMPAEITPPPSAVPASPQPTPSVPIEDKTHQASQTISTPAPPLELQSPEQPLSPAPTAPSPPPVSPPASLPENKPDSVPSLASTVSDAVSGAVNQALPNIPTMGIVDDALKPFLSSGWMDGSLMFTPQELTRLRSALLAPKPQTPLLEIPSSIQEILPEAVVEQPPPPPPPQDYALFYVTLMLYHQPKEWVVMLNQKKFFPNQESPLERVTIRHVTPKAVTLHWIPLTPISSLPEHLAERDKAHLKLRKDGSMDITLSPNQLFLVDSFRVLEGRSLSADARDVVSHLIKSPTVAGSSQMPPSPMAVPPSDPSAPVPPVASPPTNASPPVQPSSDNFGMDDQIKRYREAEIKNSLPQNTPQPAPESVDTSKPVIPPSQVQGATPAQTPPAAAPTVPAAPATPAVKPRHPRMH
jgi:hypothetical protein